MTSFPAKWIAWIASMMPVKSWPSVLRKCAAHSTPVSASCVRSFANWSLCEGPNNCPKTLLMAFIVGRSPWLCQPNVAGSELGHDGCVTGGVLARVRCVRSAKTFEIHECLDKQLFAPIQKRPGRWFRPGLQFFAIIVSYSPLNFRCHQPLRWGTAGASPAPAFSLSPGFTTTRSILGSLDPVS